MGMSTHVVGIRAPDEKWRKMKAIWDSCREANIDPPRDVMSYFDDESPDERGVIVNLKKSGAIEDYQDDHSSGFQVDLGKLPKDLTHIRFYNSW